MAQIKPFATVETEIVQRREENAAKRLSRPGVATDNPPSTNLPASVKLASSQPPLQVPIFGQVPKFDPISGPLEALDGRSVNNTPPTLSVNLTEKDINDSQGGKPRMPNVIAKDGFQTITNDQPGAPDFTP